MAKNDFAENYQAKILLLGIYTPDNPIKNMDAYFDEFLNLVDTLGSPSEHTMLMKVRGTEKANFLTKGKLQEVIDYCDKHKIEEVICSEPLSALQERNLADVLGVRIFDRAQLILDIFSQSAHSAEGKVQVEIAELSYLKTRLAGRGLEMAQQEGYVGGRGPGETAKESLRRYYETKIKNAQKRLKTLERSRDVQRKRRLASGIGLVSLVGYTNAGKSSILNALTKSDVEAVDKLFATLDTTTRELFLTEEKKVLLSDTVGFISNLPHHLVDAFKATLDELRYADLILHVVDISSTLWQDQLSIANSILHDIVQEPQVLYVFNKIDAIGGKDAVPDEALKHTPHVLINTIEKDGREDLRQYVTDYSVAKKYKYLFIHLL